MKFLYLIITSLNFGFHKHTLQDVREAQDKHLDFLDIGEGGFFYNNMTFLDTLRRFYKKIVSSTY